MFEPRASAATAVSAYDVAAVLRDRLPGLPTKKLHKLLYYCQGHHLATFAEPLFSETISAWDMGPVVGRLWHDEKQGGPQSATRELDEAQLNTIGYVLSRYGALTGRDLETLTHGETPWQLADAGRRPGESARIRNDWIMEFFRSDARTGDADDDVLLDSATVTQWLQTVKEPPAGPGRPDQTEELLARLEALHAKYRTSA